MSKTLEEALGSVELQPGRSYECEVNGLPIRVEVGRKSLVEEPLDLEADTMLDPWVDLRQPCAAQVVKARIVPRSMPEPPPIPTDEE